MLHIWLLLVENRAQLSTGGGSQKALNADGVLRSGAKGAKIRGKMGVQVLWGIMS